MYGSEVPQIRNYLEKGPEEFLSITAFVIASIQTPLIRVKEQVKSVKKLGSKSPALWGYKRQSWEYVKEHQDTLYKHALRAPEKPQDSLLEFLGTPGLGLVKAGFLTQISGGDVGCIDVHNLKLYNIKPSLVKCGPNLSLTTKMKKVESYFNLCQELGGAEKLWDSWCTHVAARGGHNRSLDTAEKVSRYHVESIRN